MSPDDVDQMTVEQLCGAVYAEVLGEERPIPPVEEGYVLYNHRLSLQGNWGIARTIPDRDRFGYVLAEWQPLPPDGLQMMKVVRAMAEKGCIVKLYIWEEYSPDSKRESANVKIFKDGHCIVDDQEFWAEGNSLEVATFRAALKAVRATKKEENASD